MNDSLIDLIDLWTKDGGTEYDRYVVAALNGGYDMPGFDDKDFKLITALEEWVDAKIKKALNEKGRDINGDNRELSQGEGSSDFDPQPPTFLSCSEYGLNLIKSFEELRLEAYDDATGKTIKDISKLKGNLTIGYGHKLEDQTKIPSPITEELALTIFVEDVHKHQQAVQDMVKINLFQHEFDALVSFVYNIGVGGFSKSTTLKKLNQNDKEGAAKAMLMWNKQTIDGVRKISPGLQKRRNKEMYFFVFGF